MESSACSHSSTFLPQCLNSVDIQKRICWSSTFLFSSDKLLLSVLKMPAWSGRHLILWSPPVTHWPGVNCPELTRQHFVSLCTVEQPTDPHPPNLSVISDWPSLWQVSGLKLNTCDKFYKDEILAKGLFRQLRHFIPQLPPGAFQGSWGSHCCLHFKNEKKNVSLHSITVKGVPHPLT